MPTRPPHPISTDEHRPPTGKVEGLGQAVLLAAFPAQVLVPLPASGILVGRDWLARSGLNDTMLHNWPENVRGLERVVAAADPAAGLKVLVVEQVLGMRASASAAPPPTREAILAALAACNENKSQAATRLGLSRPQLLRLLKAMMPRDQKV